MPNNEHHININKKTFCGIEAEIKCLFTVEKGVYNFSSIQATYPIWLWKEDIKTLFDVEQIKKEAILKFVKM